MVIQDLWGNTMFFLTTNKVNIWGSMLQTIGLLILFVMIICAAYFITKWIASVQYHKYKGNHMQIIESIGIAPQKFLQLVKVGNQIFLIGVTKEHIVFLTEISMDSAELEENNQGSEANQNFRFYLEKWMEQKKK